jgi:VWFA-related protein
MRDHQTTGSLLSHVGRRASECSPRQLVSTTEEVGEGDVVRIDTNLVTVPVSVLDRDGRFISDLRREQFNVFENGVEQKIAYFESTEKPFTVALLLDTSGSTFFHLWEIKEAAISFAKQLRPQDRVLVVTFDRLVMLLTEATNDSNVVTEVVERNAITGFSTRLYDALDLVIKARLNKIDGRKAIVLFTDGVDTASYQATYQSTLHEVEELDALIYPIQYDTTDFVDAQTRTNTTIVTTTISGRHLSHAEFFASNLRHSESEWSRDVDRMITSWRINIFTNWRRRQVDGFTRRTIARS